MIPREFLRRLVATSVMRAAQRLKIIDGVIRFVTVAVMNLAYLTTPTARGVVLAFLTAGCGPVPGPPGPPPPPPAVRAVGALVRSQAGQGIAGATCRLQDTPGWVSATSTSPDGYLLWTPILGSLRATRVECVADGYQLFAESRTLQTGDNETLEPLVLVPAHVDPSGIPLEQLAAIRGAMWPLGTASTCGPVPLGPRPGQPDNVLATDFITDYPPTVQACIIAELKARGYTHVVMGPLVDSDGYHGLWTPNDWRGVNFERFLDAHQQFWDAGLAVVTFIHPDGWSFERTRDELTPLLRQPRAQDLIRIVVPAGWEPTRYGWSSCTWGPFGQWARETLPRALVLLHTVADVDAPAGTDARCNDDDHGQNPAGNAGAWARVAPFYHGWLMQSAAFADPSARGDQNHPEFTNFQNWQNLFRPDYKGSYRDRFEHGYAGWPRGSAWGPDQPLRVYAGEYSAYWRFWAQRTEAEGVAWGNAAMAAGAAGYLDGGSVAVPVRR